MRPSRNPFLTRPSRGSTWSTAFAVLVVALAVVLPRAAAAQPPDPALLERLSHHAEALRQVEKVASYREETLMEELEGDGKVGSSETRVSRVQHDGSATHAVLEQCIRDGQDVTADERQKKEDGTEIHIKFPDFTSSAADYTYDQIDVDPADPTRVKLSFTPKQRTKDSIEGTLWVDTASGTVLTVGAKLSKPPMFVDWAHFTVEFGAKTPLGPMMSRLTFEASASFWFLHLKHVRGEIKMSDYRLP
jgi:hypothetical protein